VQDLTERSKAVLADHPVNRERIARGQLPATQIWLFWPGMKPELVPSFAAANGGRTAALTSGVDLLRGLAMQTGVDLVSISGVTDDGDNDYSAQMAGALAALDDHDVVFVHVEAPDEASHAGDVQGKVRAIEQVDTLMVPQLLDGAPAGRHKWADTHEVRLLVLPDHPTPLELKTHVAEPVPFVMWGPGFGPNGASAYTERETRATGFAVAPGHSLLSRFLA
jgi:2,3-bisphosphoglycerate-independent phosphoglycerate mutase